MKIASFSALSLLALSSLPWSSCLAKDILQKGDLVAICGDSITEQRQYSRFMEEYLLMCQPKPELTAMQFGWSGERAPGFVARVENDVLPFKPNVATLCYGMNDGNYAPIKEGTGKTYREAMTEAVTKLKQGGVRAIVVGSPGVVDPASFRNPNVKADVYNETLKALTEIAKEVAEAQGVEFADVNSVMMDAMMKAKATLGDQYTLARDGVHPAANGHILMAYAFLKALGCDGEIGTIRWDAASGKAETDSAQKILNASKTSLDIESTRYPFCISKSSDGMDAQTMAEFIPFNQDLNRYMLVVANPPAKARVTWGSESREYTGEQLAKGVNLAADFTTNPFTRPFQQVADAIREQQDFEVKGIKGQLHSLISWEKDFGVEPSALESLRGLVVKKSRELIQASKAALAPVKHTIQLEAIQ